MSMTLLKMPDLATTDTWVRDFKCPACRTESVCLGAGNYLTCGNLDCTSPDVAEVVSDLVARDLKTTKELHKSAQDGPDKPNRRKEP